MRDWARGSAHGEEAAMGSGKVQIPQLVLLGDRDRHPRERVGWRSRNRR
jgi:hypothetical protein